MHGEIHGLARFYASAAGGAAERFLSARLARIWPEARGCSLLGLGWAAPYLGLWRAEATRCVALVPAELGRPEGFAPGEAASGAETRLPFPDRVFDRVLLVHGLEAAENARRLLREVWRVTADEGRVLIAVPNRRGLWAQFEHTPFGHGQPYSAGQLARLLERQMFRVQRRDAALFWPPLPWARAQRLAGPWEATGRAIWPERYAGVVLVEAAKELFGGVPAGAVAVGRRVVAELR